jgi:hypothetical protein
MTEGDEMTISESNLANWLDGLPDDEISARRRSAEQRRARAEQALARLNADARRIDTRRKIVVGGAVMSAARRDDRFRGLLFDTLNAVVVTPRDRALLGLPTLLANPAEENHHD